MCVCVNKCFVCFQDFTRAASCPAPSAQPARTQSMETCHYDQYDQYEHNEGFQKIFLKLIISGQGHATSFTAYLHDLLQ